MASVMSALGQLWVSGAGVDWKEFYSDEDRRRIALPPYPFERQRYWVDPPAAAETPRASRGGRSTGRNPNVDEWFYVPGWKRVPVAIVADSITQNPRSWLLLGDEEKLAERLSRRLVEANHSVTTVVRGERYQRLGAGRYMVNPTSRADYDLLMKELIDHGQSPAVAMHLWSLGQVTDESAVSAYRQERTAGFDSLLAFAQAVGDLALPAPMRIAVVTNDAQDVTGREQLAPARGDDPGAQPGHTAGISEPFVQVDRSRAGTERTGWRRLAARGSTACFRMSARSTETPSSSYRDGHRWVQTFSPLTLPRAKGVPGRLRAKGVYLITGGLGEIGLHMAQALAESVKARVVLTGRSGIPAREEWDAHLSARGSEDPISQRILRVRQIESLGGRVLVLKADASDRAAMEAAFAAAEEQFGPINGVIHAAGLILGDAFRPIAETDPDSCRRQFEPKVDGLVVLDELIAGRDLDFCMLVSSLSSMLGGLRYGAYSAANAFMDVMAARRNRSSRYPWLTVNWDAWLRAEDEARLKAGKTLPDGFVLSGADGVDAFRRLLSADAGVQVVVSTGDLQERLHQWVGEGLKRMETVQSVKHPRPVLQTEFVAPRTPLETTIAARLAGAARHREGRSDGQLLRARRRFVPRHPAHREAQGAARREAVGCRAVRGAASEPARRAGRRPDRGPGRGGRDRHQSIARREAARAQAAERNGDEQRPRLILMSSGTPNGTPASGIAIIGMVCRVPGAANIDEFWRNLTGGVESIRTLSREELLAAGAKEEDIDASRLRAGRCRHRWHRPL